MAKRGARVYNGGLGTEPPAGSRAEPLVGGGKAPLKLKQFWTFIGSRKIAHFSKIWKRRQSQIFALFRKK